MQKVLFVCLGNICRSPTAEGIARATSPVGWVVDSAGTSAYHVGEQPDERMQKTTINHKIDISTQRSRQVQAEDFYTFHFIVAMDEENLQTLLSICPKDSKASIFKLLPNSNVPDPYYGGPDGFESCYKIIQNGIDSFWKKVIL